jgi:RNA polymerase-binding transcription factor DksA
VKATTLAVHRRRLERLLRAAVARASALERDLDDMAVEVDVETMDRIQEEVAAGVLAKLDEHDRREAEEVHAALERIRDGSYGKCSDCGRAIAAARLKALPAAPRCTACQGRFEARA